MHSRQAVWLVSVLALAPAARAQHTAGGAPALPPAEARQFDFLLGQWDLDVRPQVSSLAARIHGVPHMSGTWKAWAAFDGWGIEDELRIVNPGAVVQALTHALRVFDANAGRWSQTSLDVPRARFSPSTAEWSGKEMVVTAQATDQDGKSFVARIRFFDISANAFSYEQARSYDGGRTWDKPTLTMSAKRKASAAPRDS